jgi:hypothetical protein
VSADQSSPPSIDALIDIVESLRGGHLRRRSLEEVHQKLQLLVRAYQAWGLGTSEHQVWYRARRCEDENGYSNLRDCLYPPKKIVGYGRANLPREPVLYSAWNINTALDEISAESDDFVQITFVRVRPGLQIPCVVIGDYAHVYNSGRSQYVEKIADAIRDEIKGMSPEDFKRTLFVDTFLAEEYSRPHGRPFEFKLTAAYASMIFAGNGGLTYPSIERRGGMNMAVAAPLFDSSYEVVYTVLFRVRAYYGCGVYDLQGVKGSSAFAADGTINWAARSGLEGTFDLREGFRLAEGAVGWRVPHA